MRWHRQSTSGWTKSACQTPSRVVSDERVFVLFHFFPVVGSELEALEDHFLTNVVDDDAQGGEQKVILLCVLGTEQALFTPEEAISGVLIPAHVQECWRNQTAFGDKAPRCCHGLVFAGLQMERGHMCQHTLTSKTTAANPLALLRHGKGLPQEGVEKGLEGAGGQSHGSQLKRMTVGQNTRRSAFGLRKSG